MNIAWPVLIMLSGLASNAQEQWHLQWMRELPARKPAWEFTPRMTRDVAYEPTVQSRLALVGCEHNAALLALDVGTGQEQWRFYTNGPIRFAPVADAQQIYVASDDGCLYCLDHSGRLQWKFRGGPSERKVIGHERLISMWPASARPLLAEGKLYFVAGFWPTEGIFIHALDPRTGERIWTYDMAQVRPSGQMQVADGTLFVQAYGGRIALDAATGRPVTGEPPKVEPPAPVAAPEGVEGTVASTAITEGRLFVSTVEGRVYCFAENQTEARIHPRSMPAQPGESGMADEILAASKVREGYCLVLGLNDPGLVEGLLRNSSLYVIAVDRDAAKVDALRRRFDEQGLFDEHRLQLCAGDPQAFGLPPYIANLIISGPELGKAAFPSLRPYGGALVERTGGQLRVTLRNGPLPGAADWTHEFADETNCLASSDTVIKAPLGFVWYGGPAADVRYYFNGLVDHQSGDGISPLWPNAEVVDGRMIIQGPGILAAVDVYTGRLLWEAAIPKVYVWGGKEGGLGIHSKKHPEPWKYPEALAMEVPPTHQCRASGFNYVTVSDGIYVAAGKRLLRLSPTDGKVMSDWPVPLSEELCWGNIRIAGDLLVATAFRPQDIIDAQAGHDGNGGDWAKDRMRMSDLLVVNRQSGKLLWSRKATWGFLNQGTAVGGGKVFCVDLLTETVLGKFREAGRKLPAAPPAICAFDVKSGAEVWRCETDVLVKQLTYSKQRDILLAPCRNLTKWADGTWSASPEKNAPGLMRGFRGADGKLLWEVAEAQYFEPHIILHDLVIDRYGWTYDLLTGKPAERVSPLTGLTEPWNFTKGGCNHLIASENLVTWRTAFYDLGGMSGVMPLTGLDAGCSPTFIPADGVLSAGNFATHFKRNRSTALCFAHLPSNDIWTVYRDQRSNIPPAQGPIIRAGFNFGAPGDRRAEDGTLWLTVVPRKLENVSLQPAELEWFQFHSTRMDSWVASSGVKGVTEIGLPTVVSSGKNPPRSDGQTRQYDIRLYFAEPEPLRPGDRVFTVSIEGAPVLRDLDIVKEAGGMNRPVVREFKAMRVEGELNLSFSPTQGQALLCGVEIAAN